MNTGLFAILVILGAGLLIGLFIVMFLVLASHNMYAAIPKKGDISFVVAGENLKKTWPIVDGHRMSYDTDAAGRHWLIKETDKKKIQESWENDMHPATRPLQRFLWETFGARWVSIWYPQVKIHNFNIEKRRLISGTEAEGVSSLNDMVEEEADTVSSLRFIIPRPVYLEGVELPGDNARIDMITVATFKVVIPSLPIFYYKGTFFPWLDAVVKSGIISFFSSHKVLVDTRDRSLCSDAEYDRILTSIIADKLGKKPEDVPKEDLAKEKLESRGITNHDLQKKFPTYAMRPLDYSLWLQLKKDDSALSSHMLRLNVSQEFYNKFPDGELKEHLEHLIGGKPKGVPEGVLETSGEGLIPYIGMALTDFDLVTFTAGEGTKDLSDARRERDTQYWRAQGVIEEAHGQKTAIDLTGQADAARAGRIARELRKYGVREEDLGQAVGNFLQAEELKNLTGTVVFGSQGGAPQGSQTSLLIDQQRENERHDTKQKEASETNSSEEEGKGTS